MNGCRLVKLSPQAELDLTDGFLFYQAQGEGLGDYFFDSLSADIDGLLIHAGVHAQPFKNAVYRGLAKRFPFAIYYVLEEAEATVLAVLDTRSHPSGLRSRLA